MNPTGFVLSLLLQNINYRWGGNDRPDFTQAPHTFLFTFGAGTNKELN